MKECKHEVKHTETTPTIRLDTKTGLFDVVIDTWCADCGKHLKTIFKKERISFDI